MKFYDIQEPSQNNEIDFKTPNKSESAIGIDLGTTNSLVAISRNGFVEIIKNKDGSSLLPSIVGFKDDEVVVGEEALKLSSKIVSVKRLMHNGASKILLGKTPVEVSAEILKALKTQAESYLGKKISKAVITVPAYFDEGARQATKDAARIAGLNVLRLVNEPTAAAVAYGLDGKEEGIFAIYDLGGGTFDVTILRMAKGVFQVLATGGDSQLGGDDFDALLLSHTTVPDNIENKMLMRQIKEHLSTHDSWVGNISVTKTEFEKLINPIVTKTLNIFAKCLLDAEVKIEEIKEIILVGGSTRTPFIKSEIAKRFGKIPLDSINPDEIVAQGAAIQAEALSVGSNSLLLDVIPLSLGVEVANGLVEHIIPRNTPIPVARKQKFATQKDNQTGFVIHVLQGEGERTLECRSLAKFELKNIPPRPAGEARLEINFQIDADGLLSVSATELSTNKKQEVVVKPSYGLTEEEIFKLIKSK
jgi:molecular chaperone HscA